MIEVDTGMAGSIADCLMLPNSRQDSSLLANQKQVNKEGDSPETLGYTNHELFQRLLEKLIVDADASGVLDRREWVLDNCLRVRTDRRYNQRVELTVFHEQIDVDLLQGDAHAGALQVGQHDELDVGRSLVVVQFVLAGGVGDETG